MKKYIISSDVAYQWPILSIITEEQKNKMLKQIDEEFKDYELVKEKMDIFYLDRLGGDMYFYRADFKRLLEESQEITEDEVKVLEKFDLLNKNKVYDIYKAYTEYDEL